MIKMNVYLPYMYTNETTYHKICHFIRIIAVLKRRQTQEL